MFKELYIKQLNSQKVTLLFLRQIFEKNKIKNNMRILYNQ